MALPTSRNTTYAAGSQVKSADLDDIQDQIIALEAHRHDDRVLVIGPPQAAFAAGASDEYIASGGAAETFKLEIPLLVGDQIKSIDCYVKGGGGTTHTARLWEETNTAGTRTDKGSVTITNDTNFQTRTINPTDYTLATGKRSYVSFEAGAAGLRVYSIQVTYNRP